VVVVTRDHGRLEGLLLAICVTAASGLAVGGVWRIAEVAELGNEDACQAVAVAQKDSLGQVVALALGLIALRRLVIGGQDPPA
jgi:hypothetical protein